MVKNTVIMKKRKKRFLFNHSEARGTVTVSKGNYGLEIDVTDRGNKWSFMIDLFHLAALGDGHGSVQCVVYNPVDPDGDPLKRIRVFPDGRVQILD